MVMGVEKAVLDILCRRGIDQAAATAAAPILVRQIVEDDPDLTVTDEVAFYELLVAVAKHSP